MKKILLTSLLLFFSTVVWSEDAISKFSMTYFSDEEYNIYASNPDKKEKFGFVVCAQSKETKEEDKCGLIIMSDELKDFIEAIKSAEAKYKEWSVTAKENNVRDFEKFFDIKLPRLIAFFYYGSSARGTKKRIFKPKFKVTDDGTCLLCIDSGTLICGNNKFIKYDGFLFAFNSVDEIEEFIKALDTTRVMDRDIKNKENNALFK